MAKRYLFIIIFTFFVVSIFAQLGIKGGVTMANQITDTRLDNLKSSDLTGFQIGLVYQWMPKKWGPGLEIGTLFSQRGSMFKHTDTDKIGYNELNYIDIPLNLHFRVSLKRIGFYVYGGMYGSCLLTGKRVSDETSGEKQSFKVSDFKDRLDYGYSLGGGIDILRRMQIGFNWSSGLRDLSYFEHLLENPREITSVFSRAYTINITFLF